MSDERRYQPLKFGSLTIADDAGVIRTFIEGNNERLVRCDECDAEILQSDDLERDQTFPGEAAGWVLCEACWERAGMPCVD